MNETRKHEEIELDIGKILKGLLRNRLLILVGAAVGTAAAFLIALMLTPKYSASVTFYVKNTTQTASGGSISSADIAASKELVESYLVILQSEETLQAVIHYAQIPADYTRVREMISAGAVNSTEFFRVEVTSADPREAEEIANAIGYILPMRIAGIMEEASIKIVDAALVPFDPSEPGYVTITAAGFAAGLVLSVFGVVLQAVTEKTIRSERDIAKACAYPILARISPEDTHEDQSYRALATKLCHFLPAQEGCRVIGAAPLGKGERRSTTALTLARCLRRRGKRVIYLDCDLCRSRTNREQKEQLGLSDFLAGKATLEQIILPCCGKETQLRFPVIPAGDCPGGGAQQLLSGKMRAALRALKKRFDYIILQLPPPGEISEAAELARETDGVLLLSTRDRSRTDALGDAAAQLEFVGVRILGVVFRCPDKKTKKTEC